MSSQPDNPRFPDDRTFSRRLKGIAFALFLTYFTVAIPLPVLTLFVTQHLGLDSGLGGLSVGIAFLSTILTRAYAGQYADKHGAKRALSWGILVYIVGSLLCLAAALPFLSHVTAYCVLLVGRLLVGFGESMSMVGFISWGLSMAGPKRSGRVIGWIGMGIYGAFAVGSPIGVMVASYTGFAGVMVTSAVMPVIGFLLTRLYPADVPLNQGKRPSMFTVLPKIWKPGLAVCLQGIGFAAISAFITPYFLTNHWSHVALGLSAFGVGFVISRLLFTHLPDRIGGFPVAYGSLLAESIGQFLLWSSHSDWMALAGSLLTGLGCSMVFPSMGLEVVKRVPAELRGTAMGGFSAFQDLAYGLTGPVIGIFIGSQGYAFPFLIGSLAALLGLLMVWMGSRDPLKS